MLRQPDPAVKAAMADLLRKRAQPPIGLKPDDAAAALAKLEEDFQAATAGKPDVDVASVVFAAAADTAAPGPQDVLFFDRLLRMRGVRSGWVELLTLRRLADRADRIVQKALPASAWNEATVHTLLDVVRRGEQAHARAAAPIWIRPWLEAAAMSRHLGEVAFQAPGFVPDGRAEAFLEQAQTLYGAIRVTQDRFDRAIGARDTAMSLLPEFLPYLEHEEALFPVWMEAIRATQRLESVLVEAPAGLPAADSKGPLPGLEILKAASERLDRAGVAVRVPLDSLQSVFREEAITSLLAKAKQGDPSRRVWQSISSLLATPFLRAEQRADLWAALLKLGSGGDSDSAATSSPGPDQGTGANASAAMNRQVVRRAEAVIELLKLAGLGPEPARELDVSVQKLAKEVETSGPRTSGLPPNWPEFGIKLRRAWDHLIEATASGEVATRSRLARSLPAAISTRAADARLSDPVSQERMSILQAQCSWLASWFEYVGMDRDLEFFVLASQELREFAGVSEIRPLAVWTGPSKPVSLDDSSAGAIVELTLEVRRTLLEPVGQPSKEASKAILPITVRIVPPQRDWLSANLAAAAPGGLEEVARVATTPDPGAFVVTPTRAGEIPLNLRLRARASGAAVDRRAEPVAGILVEAEMGGRICSRAIEVHPRPSSGDLMVLLGAAEFREGRGEARVLELRPRQGRQPLVVGLRNPTTTPREVVVEVRSGDATPPLAVSQPIPMPAMEIRSVDLAAPGSRVPAGRIEAVSRPPTSPGGDEIGRPSHPQELPAIEGPLRFRVLDARKPEVELARREVNLQVLRPGDYVRVRDAVLSPPRVATSDPNRLSLLLLSTLDASEPPSDVELVLRPERIPGLLGVDKGVWRGMLLAGDKLGLSAEGIRLDPAEATRGTVEVTVDGVERGLLLSTAFGSSRETSVPVPDGRVALRLRSPDMALTGTQLPVTLEADNAPEGARLELSLGRTLSGRSEPVRTWRYPAARNARIGLGVAQAGGGLEADVRLTDWIEAIETSGLRGRFTLLARMRREDGAILKEAQREVILDDQRPRWVNLLGVPARARRGRVLDLVAVGDIPASGIASVQFVVGKPGPDGKLPADAVTIPGTRRPGRPERWAASVTLPSDKGARQATITARLVTGVGLECTGMATVELGDSDPIVTGKVRGIVREGTLPQRHLTVGLFDAKGARLLETRTSVSGSFQFDDVAPGVYYLTTVRPVSGTKGQARTEVKADETAEVTLSLYR